jgi:hypothetical protein
MSIRVRRAIGFWFLFILGLILNGFQVYKYVTGQLVYSNLELVVLVVGVAFNFAPKFILNMFEKVITKKAESQ